MTVDNKSLLLSKVLMIVTRLTIYVAQSRIHNDTAYHPNIMSSTEDPIVTS